MKPLAGDPRPSLSFCCPEKLDTMLPAEGGRFCGKCEKMVTDFTHMTNAEITQALSSASAPACGTFHAHQLDKPFDDWRDKLVGLYQRVSGFGKRNYVRSFQLGLVAVLLFLTGCRTRMSGFRASPSEIRHNMRKSEKHAKQAGKHNEKTRKRFERRTIRKTF